MSRSILEAEEVRNALSIRDLTQPAQGPHALQLLIDDAVAALRRAWPVDVRIHRKSPIVSVRDNYDRLRYAAEATARDARYTRYVCDVALLRSQTSALIPPLLSELAEEHYEDVLLVCPGITYRRDAIDRLHTGEPHQLELWRIQRGEIGPSELEEMIRLVVGALLPGRELRTSPASHPYTTGGLQIDVREGARYVEVGECGLAHPEVLRDAGHDPEATTGLAMGLGLDRLLMLRKGVDDIRLLRSADPRVAVQMLDLEPYRPVSAMPAVRRDLSIAVPAETTAEDIGDAVRGVLGREADVVESVEIVSETAYERLPPAAVERMGMLPGQKNLLVRVILRALDRTLTHDECNVLRDRVYATLHRGANHEWAARVTT